MWCSSSNARALAWSILAGVCTAAQISAASAQTKVFVPKGTPVVVQTYNAINSATFHAGEHLAYIVTDDVIVRGTLIAKSGDAASGLVEQAQEGHKTHAGTLGALAGPPGAVAGAAANKLTSTGSNLRISVDRVKSFCGDTIRLSFVRSEYHRPKRFQKMTSVEIAKGQKYVATVAADTLACGIATSATPAPIPADALHADGS
jgi:hypothetical protein